MIVTATETATTISNWPLLHFLLVSRVPFLRPKWIGSAGSIGGSDWSHKEPSTMSRPPLQASGQRRGDRAASRDAGAHLACRQRPGDDIDVRASRFMPLSYLSIRGGPDRQLPAIAVEPRNQDSRSECRRRVFTLHRRRLELFHDEQLEKLRPPREQQLSFIVPSSGPVQGLQQVQVGGVQRIAALYEQQGQRLGIATIDQTPPSSNRTSGRRSITIRVDVDAVRLLQVAVAPGEGGHRRACP